MQTSAQINPEQLAGYHESGFIAGFSVLSPREVNEYCAHVEATVQALDGRIARLDGLHLYFRWAWELSAHPRLLQIMSQLIGRDILIESTRLFYKHGHTSTYVGWHQDGYTQNISDAHAPAIWLGLTDATADNGCLRVIPGSHRMGPLAHVSRRDLTRVVHADAGAYTADHNELSGRITTIPQGYPPAHNIEMRAGQMSLHHPLTMHGSNPNRTTEPRIGWSVSYTAPAIRKSTWPVAWVNGTLPDDHDLPVIRTPPTSSFDDSVLAYLASGCQILRCPGPTPSVPRGEL